MITPPPTWRRYGGVNVLTLVPPQGRGRVRFHDRLPPRPFAAIVDELLGREPSFRRDLVGPVTRLVTEEGEHAAWVTLAGHDPAGSVRRWIGAVLCDEFVAAIDGLSRDPELDEIMNRATRWMLLHSSFGLGVRRRRYLYEAPEGWQGLPSGLVTTWYPPDFPRRRSMLVVYPAEPSRDDAQTTFDQLFADEEQRGFVQTGALEVSSCVAASQVGGLLFSYAGAWPSEDAPLRRRVAVLTDGRYRYVMRHEAVAGGPGAGDGALLVAAARTVEPLPQQGGRTPFSAAQLPGIVDSWRD